MGMLQVTKLTHSPHTGLCWAVSSHASAVQARQPAAATPCTSLLQVEANDKPDLRLQGLAELHNVADDAATQHAMLLQSIAYAQKADLANLLAPVIRVSGQLGCKMRQGVLTWWRPVSLRCCTRVI